MEWFGIGHIRLVETATAGKASSVHMCPLIHYFEPSTVVFRNTTLTLEPAPTLTFEPADSIRRIHRDEVLSYDAPPASCNEVIQVLLPLYLQGKKVCFSPITPPMGNDPLANVVWIFWTPGPDIQWSIPSADRQYLVYQLPFYHLWQLRSRRLTIVNGNAILKGHKRHFDFARMVNREFRAVMNGTIDYVSMPDFLRRYRDYPIFSDDEISGWREAMEDRDNKN